LPPVLSDRVARPVPSSYSGNTKMPIVLAPRLSSEGRPARRTHSLSRAQAQRGIPLTGPENIGCLPTRFLIPPARSAEGMSPHSRSMNREGSTAVVRGGSPDVGNWHYAADPRCQSIGLHRGLKRTLSKLGVTSSTFMSARPQCRRLSDPMREAR
jgi:hypothetical protein